MTYKSSIPKELHEAAAEAEVLNQAILDHRHSLADDQALKHKIELKLKDLIESQAAVAAFDSELKNEAQRHAQTIILCNQIPEFKELQSKLITLKLSIAKAEARIEHSVRAWQLYYSFLDKGEL